MKVNRLFAIIALILGLYVIKSNTDNDVLIGLIILSIICLMLDQPEQEHFTDDQALTNLAAAYNSGTISLPTLALPNNGVIKAGDGTGTLTIKGNVVMDGNITVPNGKKLFMDKIELTGVETATQKELHINDTVVANKFQGQMIPK